MNFQFNILDFTLKHAPKHTSKGIPKGVLKSTPKHTPRDTKVVSLAAYLGAALEQDFT